MWKKILFFCLLSMAVGLVWRQNSTAETWARHGTAVHAESILAAIERGDSIIISGCEILGPLVREGTPERADTIRSYVRITMSAFRGWVSFKHCCFMEQVWFQADTFMVADFSHSAFVRDVNFMSTTFGSTLFTGTTFGEDVDLRWVTFQGSAVFHNAKFGKKIYLGVADFGNMYVLWEDLKGHLVYDRRSNYELMKFWEQKRQLEDADGVYLFLKNQERIRKPWYERYPEFWLIRQTCGYGIDWRRALVTCGLVIALSALFYYLIAIRESKRALGVGFRRIWLKAYNAAYFSVNTFVIGPPTDWAPEETTSSRKHYLFRILQTVERTLGWILLVLFVVTLTRKFIR